MEQSNRQIKSTLLMNLYITHTYGKRLNAVFSIVPKWWIRENPPCDRIVLIIETNYHYPFINTEIMGNIFIDWTQSSSLSI